MLYYTCSEEAGETLGTQNLTQSKIRQNKFKLVTGIAFLKSIKLELIYLQNKPSSIIVLFHIKQQLRNL